ncbi:MAG: carboxypeptidase regulatory-like domain-containing protein [Acidobacteria bacterium]|nr:carboxypeptidase regulatory-like domain-containing protein [Acidobacteriota bacterium]
MNRLARLAIVVLVAAVPLLARNATPQVQGFAAADYRDAWRLEGEGQRVVLRAAFAHSSEAKSVGEGSVYGDPFPGVRSLRTGDGRETLTIADPAALVAFDVAEMDGVVAAVREGRGIRFLSRNVREAGLAIGEPMLVDAVGRPSFGARWIAETQNGRTQIRLQLEDAMLRYPVSVTYAAGSARTLPRAQSLAKRNLTPTSYATGFVSGQVIDQTTGLPLANAVVDLFDSTGEYFNSFGTDGSGLYSAEVEAGRWYAVGSASGYGTKLYNNINCASGCTVTSGTGITVTAGATTPNINFALSSNQATVSGRVSDPGGAPLSTIFVVLYDNAGNALGGTFTDGAGNWTATASPGGTLYARTFNFVYPGLTDQVYSGIDCSGCNPTSGTAINAPNGSNVANINFALRVGATIAGTVRDTASAPVTGAFVTIYNASGTAVTTLNSDGSGFYSTVTGLAAGSYYAKATASGFDSELYDNRPCSGACAPTGGTAIPVTLGQTRSGVDFSLANAQARITGRVLSSTNAVLGGVLVQAYNASGAAVAASSSSFDDGAYELVLPSPGTYTVGTRNSVHPGYLDQLYNGIDCTACATTSGTPVSVAAGVTSTGIDFHLTNNGGSISGTVTDAVTNAPIPNATVRIYGTSGALASSAVSDGAGHYTSFAGLAAGTYYATATIFGYGSELYDGISCASGCNPTTGTAIVVPSGGSKTGVDFSLTSSFARISGKVTRASTSAALAGVDVLIYDGSGNLVGSAQTDGTGNYTASLGAAGTYYAVTAASAYPELVNQLYNGISCASCDPTTGTAISVTIGDVAENIDFNLAAAGCAAVSIQPPELPDAPTGTAYSQTLTLANASGPATFSLLSGALPPTFTLSSGGVISGSTTVTGVYTFTVSATDGTCTTTREYTIEVTAPATSTTLTASTTSGVYPVSITFTATVEPAAATGTVTFRDGATAIGTATLVGGVATLTTSALSAGLHEVTASYNGSAAFAPSTSAAIQITIAKGTPVITWHPASPITYGTPLGAAQLNATANVPGTFTYVPPPGTILSAGTYTLNASFTPSDTTNYNNASATATLVVNKATPVITWNPAPITYGTALGSSQLNATANTPGTFTYTPPAGTVLNAGNQTLSVSFVPNDTANYVSTSTTRTLVVNKATPVFSNLSEPTIIVHTFAVGISGKISFASPTGTRIPPGNVTITLNGVTKTTAIGATGNFDETFNTTLLNAGTYTITFNYAGSANYTAATATSTLKVTWNTLAIPLGTGFGNFMPFTVQLFDALGLPPSPNRVITVYGVRLASSSTWQPVPTGSPSTMTNLVLNTYTYNLRISTLPAGNYVLGYTISGGDPVVHEVAFTVR